VDCGSRSWRGALDAESEQGAAQLGEQRVQSSVHVEGGREGEQPGDLLCGEVVDETQLEQQQIARRQVGDHTLQCVVQLVVPERGVGLFALARRRLVQLELLGDEILQPASRSALLPAVLGCRTPVALAIEVEADAARDDDQPGGDSAARRARELAKTAVVVGPQVLEDLRVRIHLLVVSLTPAAAGVSGQVFGARGAEIALWSQPRPAVRLVEPAGWTAASLDAARARLEADLVPLESEWDLFGGPPVAVGG